MTGTQIQLGTLKTEEVQHEDINGGGARPVNMYCPEGTPLRNDGIWHYWMLRGCVYRLAWDQTGWQVTCDDWMIPGHTYRLAERQDMQFTDRLPLNRGVLVLERGRTYEVREGEAPGTWELFSI
jgi:hypothetical protein